MITIYNETKDAWKVQCLNDQILRFMKERKVPSKQEEGKEKYRAISTISYRKLHESVPEIQEKFDTQINATEPLLFSDARTNIIFNKKGFQPFISGHEGNRKDILLSSLFLKGRKVVNVFTENTFLLEFMIFAGEFSFIASFNEVGATLDIELLDERKKMITKYTFIRTENSIDVSTVEFKKHKNRTYELNISKFRPSRPTHTILVHPSDKEDLLKVVNPERHNIVELHNSNHDSVIASLKAENYRAVTVFTNTPSEGEVDKKEFRKYKRTVDRLLPLFNVVFKLYNDSGVHKVQF